MEKRTINAIILIAIVLGAAVLIYKYRATIMATLKRAKFW